MRYSRVFLDAIGYELPPVVVTSRELEARLRPVYQALHLPEGQLEALTGISERRMCAPDETTAQQGAGSQVEPRSTISSAIFTGSSVVLTARTISMSASRRSTRLRSARWKTRNRVARSRPGVVNEISLARRSFDPPFPAGPTA